MDSVKGWLHHMIWLMRDIDWLGPALAGGLANYLAQPRKESFWRWLIGMGAHLPVALFFGWLMGQVAIAKGMSPTEITIWAGGGAYLGSQIAELFLYGAYRYLGKHK